MIINNLKIAQSKAQLLYIQILLGQVIDIFKTPKIQYFLKLYDWNFMAEGICQKTLQMLFTFTEDRNNDKKPEFDLYKRSLQQLTNNVEAFLVLLKDIKHS